MSDRTIKMESEDFPESVRAPVRYVLLRSLFARPSKRSLARDERGVVAVMLAIMLAALLGMLGLAMDLGKVWNLETQLQHGADAGALAGVTATTPLSSRARERFEGRTRRPCNLQQEKSLCAD